MKILFGICGIGNGHTFRQFPIFEHFLNQGHDIMVFGYGGSLEYFSKKYPNHPKVTVVEVANIYYVGNATGLDYYKTQHHASNKNKDFNAINAAAMAKAAEKMGKPDLVISDYESTSAQYAYATGAPLVTLDQQSKFLYGDFDPLLNGCGYADEVQRLRMFFPKAKERYAISFFSVKPSANKYEDVLIFAPILRDNILKLKGNGKTLKTTILVYISEQKHIKVTDQFACFENRPDVNFHIFLPKDNMPPSNFNHGKGLYFHPHGSENYYEVLAGCHGAITTAGHTLLSELMYLEKPVYAMPLDLYEQQINAKAIASNGFGISHPTISAEKLDLFLQNLNVYTKNIQQDPNQALEKGSGLSRIIEKMETVLKPAPAQQIRFIKK